MSIGQRNNPLWLDARQWRVTTSNFGKVCNRNFKQLYPVSLIKTILGDYGVCNTAALQWGCDHESDALQQYMALTGICIEECGVFLSEEYPYLATYISRWYYSPHEWRVWCHRGKVSLQAS